MERGGVEDKKLRKTTHPGLKTRTIGGEHTRHHVNKCFERGF